MSQAGLGMEAELRQAPEAVRQQSKALSQPVAVVLERLRRKPPGLIVTCARGSSAHAATFGKHLFERHLGIPCAAFAPNIATVYRRPLRLKDQLFLTISQSGRSDDLVESTAMARLAGAFTVALVNDTDSPLARTAEAVLPVSAGPELSVAATKTFVATLTALLRLTAAWAEDGLLTQALNRLPDRLTQALTLDWHAADTALTHADSLVSIGRGPTLAIAREAALKLKETCNLHAEAFSGAEFLHGPVSLVSSSYPILMFMPTDQAAEGLHALAQELRHKGAAVFETQFGQDGAGGAGVLPALAPDHPDTDAICLIQSFYTLAVGLARRRGTNVDQPRHLRKVTRTR